ncbi:MAG: SAM-dependent DNA methyltransferase [Variibacter sp.]|nr:SAM-dependent DNA methyltransferase [Variibacter sp.]
MRQTYEKLDALRREGRNTIWSYVARNLSRPLHLSSAERRADVVVGNPPWVALGHRSKEFQKRFKEVAEGENVYVGGKLATQADLSALFFAKSVAFYLREGGTMAFVMPLAALTRGQFEKFRTGAFHRKKVQFTEAWTFDEDVQPLFPVPSCVLFAKAERGLSVPTPKTVTAYKGQLPLATPTRKWPTSTSRSRPTRRRRARRRMRADLRIARRFGRARPWCRACCAWRRRFLPAGSAATRRRRW